MERTVLYANPQSDPATGPLDASPGLPLICDQHGVLWQNLALNTVLINGKPNNTDTVASVATPTNLPVVSYSYVYDSVNSLWRRANGIASNALNALAPSSTSFLAGAFTINMLYGGTNYRRNYEASAVNLALTSGEGAQIVGSPGEWAVNHAPVANTIATVTKAAGGAGIRHVCRGFSVSINAVAAIAAPLVVNLRDGATGAGTILWTDRLMALAGTTTRLDRSGLNIVGSANTAMTLEFTAAPGATNFENVNLNGFSAG